MGNFLRRTQIAMPLAVSFQWLLLCRHLRVSKRPCLRSSKVPSAPFLFAAIDVNICFFKFYLVLLILIHWISFYSSKSIYGFLKLKLITTNSLWFDFLPAPTSRMDRTFSRCFWCSFELSSFESTWSVFEHGSRFRFFLSQVFHQVNAKFVLQYVQLRDWRMQRNILNFVEIN